MVLLMQVIGRPGTPTIIRAESGETVDRLVSFLVKEGDKKIILIRWVPHNICSGEGQKDPTEKKIEMKIIWK